MALPKVLKNFNVFNDGHNYVGLCQKIKLPNLKRIMESYRGGGMNGPVDIDMGVDALECEHEYAGIERQLFEQWGIPRADGVLLRFEGAFQDEASGQVLAGQVVLRGRHEEVELGEAEGGKPNPMRVKSKLTYYKLSIDGQPVVEIDLVNMIEIVGGTDRLAEQRRAIGLA